MIHCSHDQHFIQASNNNTELIHSITELCFFCDIKMS